MKSCAACGTGLHKRTYPGWGRTLFVCADCGWHVWVAGELDEARLPGEHVVPGQTGETKGYVAAKVVNGKVVKE